MPDYTPGPWRISGLQTEYHLKLIDSDEGQPVAAIIHKYPCDLDETERANARLVAAAPELLEALEELMNHLSLSEFPFEAWNRACAARAKAKGE